jgi:hypothetical protein
VKRSGGRLAIKYEGKGVSAASGSATFAWIDPALKFVVKWEEADGGAELRNIKEGATVGRFVRGSA